MHIGKDLREIKLKQLTEAENFVSRRRASSLLISRFRPMLPIKRQREHDWYLPPEQSGRQSSIEYGRTIAYSPRDNPPP
jgi:hypothetical protein